MIVDLNSAFRPMAVVVANGSLPQSDETRRILAEAPHILVCDGALKAYLQITNRKPDAVIGDGDSISSEDLTRAGVSLMLVSDQESNDLSKAVRYAQDKGWKELLILGATGKREDHTLGNICLLAEYYKAGVRPYAYSAYGWIMPFQGELTLQAQVGQGLSLFPTAPLPMSAEGVAYPFTQRTFKAPWEATLNYTTAPTVQLYSEGVALLFISHEKRPKVL